MKLKLIAKNQKTAKTGIHKGSEEGGAETSWGKGDCFKIAGRAMLHPKTRGLKLVHAYVSGQGKLEGRSSIFPKPIRFPKTRARAKPAAPALMWTAVPPAKSSALILVAIKPPPLASWSPK